MNKLFNRLVILVIVFTTLGCSVDDEFGCQLSLNLSVDEAQLARDIEIIDDFLAENGISAQTDPSGLRYVISEPGAGAVAGLCDQVSVTYAGRLLSTGEQFDASSNPINFVLGGLITGWQIGIPLIQPGGSVTLYIPSVYGYGESGIGTSIPGNANLIFDIDLVSVN